MAKKIRETWQQRLQKSMNLIIIAESYDHLCEAMEKPYKMVLDLSERCEKRQRQKQANRLSCSLRKFLYLCHSYKETLPSSEKMTFEDIMSRYISVYFKALFVSNCTAGNDLCENIMSTLLFYLKHFPEHIVDAILRVVDFFQTDSVFSVLFRKVMLLAQDKLGDTLYLKLILLTKYGTQHLAAAQRRPFIKLAKSIPTDLISRKNINKLIKACDLPKVINRATMTKTLIKALKEEKRDALFKILYDVPSDTEKTDKATITHLNESAPPPEMIWFEDKRGDKAHVANDLNKNLTGKQTDNVEDDENTELIDESENADGSQQDSHKLVEEDDHAFEDTLKISNVVTLKSDDQAYAESDNSIRERIGKLEGGSKPNETVQEIDDVDTKLKAQFSHDISDSSSEDEMETNAIERLDTKEYGSEVHIEIAADKIEIAMENDEVLKISDNSNQNEVSNHSDQDEVTPTDKLEEKAEEESDYSEMDCNIDGTANARMQEIDQQDESEDSETDESSKKIIVDDSDINDEENDKDMATPTDKLTKIVEESDYEEIECDANDTTNARIEVDLQEESDESEIDARPRKRTRFYDSNGSDDDNDKHIEPHQSKSKDEGDRILDVKIRKDCKIKCTKLALIAEEQSVEFSDESNHSNTNSTNDFSLDKEEPVTKRRLRSLTNSTKFRELENRMLLSIIPRLKRRSLRSANASQLAEDPSKNGKNSKLDDEAEAKGQSTTETIEQKITEKSPTFKIVTRSALQRKLVEQGVVVEKVTDVKKITGNKNVARNESEAEDDKDSDVVTNTDKEIVNVEKNPRSKPQIQNKTVTTRPRSVSPVNLRSSKRLRDRAANTVDVAHVKSVDRKDLPVKKISTFSPVGAFILEMSREEIEIREQHCRKQLFMPLTTSDDLSDHQTNLSDSTSQLNYDDRLSELDVDSWSGSLSPSYSNDFSILSRKYTPSKTSRMDNDLSLLRNRIYSSSECSVVLSPLKITSKQTPLQTSVSTPKRTPSSHHNKSSERLSKSPTPSKKFHSKFFDSLPRTCKSAYRLRPSKFSGSYYKDQPKV